MRCEWWWTGALLYSVVVPASDWDIFGVLVHLYTIRSISCRMCMMSLDSVWAGCPYALCYLAALTITLYKSDPACHYLVFCNVVRGLRS